MNKIIKYYWDGEFKKMVDEVLKFGVSDFSILIVRQSGISDHVKVDLLSHFIQYSN